MTTKLIMTAELMQAYLEMQRSSGIEKGSLVRILCKANSEKLGWIAKWADDISNPMSNTIGKVGKVVGIYSNSGIGVAFENNEYHLYPWFVLEKVSTITINTPNGNEVFAVSEDQIRQIKNILK